jgi:peptidyl-dipeptidase A
MKELLRDVKYCTKELTITFNTSGFHEAVGDTIALSVSTPQHLEKVGLLENYTDTEEDNINALMQIALQKVSQSI